MNYKTVLNEDIRLRVLKTLALDADYKTNDSVLWSALTAAGHAISRDQLMTTLNWLAEQDLVTTEPEGNFFLIGLTPRGLDVAESRTTVPGVRKPMPGE